MSWAFQFHDWKLPVAKGGINGISFNEKSSNVGYASNAWPIVAPTVSLTCTSYGVALLWPLTFITLPGNKG